MDTLTIAFIILGMGFITGTSSVALSILFQVLERKTDPADLRRAQFVRAVGIVSLYSSMFCVLCGLILVGLSMGCQKCV